MSLAVTWLSLKVQKRGLPCDIMDLQIQIRYHGNSDYKGLAVSRHCYHRRDGNTVWFKLIFIQFALKAVYLLMVNFFDIKSSSLGLHRFCHCGGTILGSQRSLLFIYVFSPIILWRSIWERYSCTLRIVKGRSFYLLYRMITEYIFIFERKVVRFPCSQCCGSGSFFSGSGSGSADPVLKIRIRILLST